MSLLKCRDRRISPKATCEILHNLECFFVRRAICGHEPSGLHAVFKDFGMTYTRDASEVISKIKILPTVKVPNDIEVEEHVFKPHCLKNQ